MAYVNLGQVVYPVGSVYVSYTNVSPASLFGGNWIAITGRFPYFNAGTSTGGANSHNHTTTFYYHNWGGALITYGNSEYIFGQTADIASGWQDGVSPAGRASRNIDGWYQDMNAGMAKTLGQSFFSSTTNNMPAYQTFYAWRRTS